MDFIEGSAQTLFSLRALFGATWIHTYAKIASDYDAVE